MESQHTSVVGGKAAEIAAIRNVNTLVYISRRLYKKHLSGTTQGERRQLNIWVYLARTCIGPNFSKLGVRNDTSVSLTTRPSVSTKPLGQANLMFTTPEIDENPIPVICRRREALNKVGVQWSHTLYRFIKSLSKQMVLCICIYPRIKG